MGSCEALVRGPGVCMADHPLVWYTNQLRSASRSLTRRTHVGVCSGVLRRACVRGLGPKDICNCWAVGWWAHEHTHALARTLGLSNAKL